MRRRRSLNSTERPLYSVVVAALSVNSSTFASVLSLVAVNQYQIASCQHIEQSKPTLEQFNYEAYAKTLSKLADVSGWTNEGSLEVAKLTIDAASRPPL